LSNPSKNFNFEVNTHPRKEKMNSFFDITVKILGFVGAIFLIRAVISLVLNKFQHKGKTKFFNKTCILRCLLMGSLSCFTAVFIAIVSGEGINMQPLYDYFVAISELVAKCFGVGNR
jgi:hypothetical protein